MFLSRAGVIAAVGLMDSCLLVDIFMQNKYNIGKMMQK